MTNIAEVRDALELLGREKTRGDALQTAVDTVSRYIQAQPNLDQQEQKLANAKKELTRVTEQTDQAVAFLNKLKVDQQTIINDTKKDVKRIRDEAEEGIQKAKNKCTTVNEGYKNMCTDFDKKIQLKRKELETVNREIATLKARL